MLPSRNVTVRTVLQVKYILDQDVSAAQHLAEKLRVPLSVVGKPTQWDAVCEDARWGEETFALGEQTIYVQCLT